MSRMPVGAPWWAWLLVLALGPWAAAPLHAQDWESGLPAEDADDSMTFDGSEDDYEGFESQDDEPVELEPVELEPVDPQPEDDYEEFESQDDEPELDSEIDEAAGESESQPSRVQFVAEAGAGVSMLAYSRPTAAGRQSLPAAVAGAARVRFELTLAPANRVAWRIDVEYQTSLGLEVDLEPLFGLDQRVPLRQQRADLTVAPVWRLGDSPSGVALAFPVGFVLRALTPKLHQFELADRLLFGPQLRVELRVPLGDSARLRLAPEVVWLAYVDPSLKAQGTGSSGVSGAALVALEAQLGQHLQVGLNYRESHALIGSGDRKYTDMERFITANLGGRF